MVKGRKGLYLEAWKFGVYVSIPVFASVYFSNPETQRYWADYWQYIKYPENPNTNVKEKIQELVKEKELKAEQSLVYKQQLRELQVSAERSRKFQEDPEKESAPSWWRRAGRWVAGSKKDAEN